MQHAQRVRSLLMAALVAVGGCTASGSPQQQIMKLTLSPEGTRIVLGPNNTSDARLYDTTIELPPGALGQPTEVTLSLIDTLAATDETAVGPALRLTPANLPLQKPLQLTLPYDKTQVTYLDELRVVVAGKHQDTPNPLRRGVVGMTAPVPFQVSTEMLGDFQSLIRHPSTLPDFGIYNPNPVDKIDILFVIDNSSSMAAKQKFVIEKFRSFINKIISCNAKIHIGVVTTDMGIVPAGMGKWPGSNDIACDTEKGDDGELRSQTCIDSPDRNDANCKSVCNNTKINGGAKFIEVDTKSATSNLPSGKVNAAEVADAFSCIAYQGQKGCGIEMPLASALRAIENVNNKDFWQFDRNTKLPRSDQKSLQLLVFITDEDDCSVLPSKRMLTNPVGTTPYIAGMPDAMNFGHNFRCFAMSTTCDQSLTSDGTKTNCKPQMASPYLHATSDLAKTISGNRRVLIGGIWPLMPVHGDVKEYGPVNSVNLQYMTPIKKSQMLDFKRHDCHIPTLPAEDGASEQHRLSQFADDSSFLAGYQVDICKPAEYPDVFTILYDALHKATGGTCKP